VDGCEGDLDGAARLALDFIQDPFYIIPRLHLEHFPLHPRQSHLDRGPVEVFFLVEKQIACRMNLVICKLAIWTGRIRWRVRADGYHIGILGVVRVIKVVYNDRCVRDIEDDAVTDVVVFPREVADAFGPVLQVSKVDIMFEWFKDPD